MIVNGYVPEVCVWEVTLRCNMRCLHCGSKAGISKTDELKIDECLRVADDLLDLGCKQVTFIGGEVFFYNGWQRIARHLSDGGVMVNIVTNGYMLGETHLEQIQLAGLKNVGLSLDGMQRNHNQIRRGRDSFAEVLKAFGLLRKGSIPIAVVTSLFDFNVFDLDEMYELLVENGVSIWQLQIATPMGNMAANKNLSLKAQQYLLSPSS